MEQASSYPEQCQRPTCGHPKREHKQRYFAFDGKFRELCQMASCDCRQYLENAIESNAEKK